MIFYANSPSGGKFLHADGHTYRQKNKQSQGQIDMTNPIVALRNFANAPKKC